MKKNISANVFFLFISFSIFSQQQIDIPVELHKGLSSSKSIDEYIGSVYVFKDFRSGILNYEGRQVPLKFNINTYSNSISYIDQFGKINELNYNPKIIISIGNQNFIYLKVNNREIVATPLAETGSTTIYKSYIAKFTQPRPSSNGYDLPKPGKVEIKKNYIFFIEGKYTIVDSNKKAIIRAFPNFKKLIKSQRLRFKSDKDFIKFYNIL
ncbi:MAG: hypothetical protein ACR2MJ_04840 [Flavobacteriaceae bacterium]